MIDNTNYGIIEFRLKEIMDDRNISINQMSKRINVAYDIVKKYYYGQNYSISLETLKKFCFILDCKIEDIIKYYPAETLIK